MKQVNKTLQRRVRSKTNPEIYYTVPELPNKDIDGVTFIPVIKTEMPIDSIGQRKVFYMRKDNMEFVK